ncbi:very short patch repair endonuclease [Lentzea sp. NPDC005914]|uniref:very short patch repair endonuclease n=1 Tax=Lentzea sp. NPDC005914 TaxID=3154572 RepID=UPI0033BFF4D0
MTVRDHAWKPRAGRSRAMVAAEQDRAAGGRYRRAVHVGDDRIAYASVELKLRSDAAVVRAYLRWSDNGRSRSRLLGEVLHGKRADNLAEGWSLARAQGLVHDVELPDDSWASSHEVRASMRGNKSRDTGPEVKLRSLLHARGLRYRVSARPLPSLRRTADIVFPKARVAVFVDGCYWHGCSEHYRPSSTNSEFWWKKIAGNRERDAETNQLLSEAGWTVVRAWEHEEPERVADRVANAVNLVE